MKTLTTKSIILLCISTGLYAQNKIDLTQSGTRPTATITQPGVNNTAIVTQGGVDAQVSIYQAGVGNQVGLEQGAGLGNKAAIEQRGTAGLVTMSQAGDGNTLKVVDQGDRNLVEGKQEGPANTIEIQQVGDDQKISIIQEGDANSFDFIEGFGGGYSPSGNEIRATQLGSRNRVTLDGGMNSNNEADLFQKGADNEVYVVGEIYSSSELDVKQQGNQNRALVNLRGTSSLAMIEQVGDQNWTWLAWFGPQNSTFKVFQKGTNNRMSTPPTLSTSYWTPGSFNEVQVIQEGNGNETGYRNGESNYNQAMVRQIGENNHVILSHEGRMSQSSALVFQSGARNQGDIKQFTDNNQIQLVQTGTDLKAYLSQGYKSGGVGNANVMKVEQQGYEDQIEANQESFGSEMIISQGLPRGGKNNIVAEQYGLFNSMKITQDGILNDAKVYQQGGAGNRASVSQKGRANVGFVLQQSYSDLNQATLVQDGIGNDGSINQLGAGSNQATLTQTGNGLYGYIYQNGSGHIANVSQPGDGARVVIRQGYHPGAGL